MSLSVSTSGDIGDIVFLLGIIRQIPDGPHTLCLRYGNSTKYRTATDIQRLYDIITHLAASQSYIAEVKIIEPTDFVDWASEKFRENGLFFTPGESLMQAHLNNLITTHGFGHVFSLTEPWLTVEPSKQTAGRVVINRTERYRNHLFDWASVVRHYGERLMFIGLPHEHQDFCNQFGEVTFLPTITMLGVAQAIAGSDLFIGNQSSANAVNEGLKHRSIQETCLDIPDCVFGRDNGVFCGTGDCVLPDIAGSGEFHMRYLPSLDIISASVMPAGGWQFPGEITQQHIEAAITVLRRNQREKYPTHAEARAAILRYNYDRVPSFFSNLDTGGSKYKIALETAARQKV